MRRLKTVRRPPIYPNVPSHLPCSSLTHPAAVLTPSIGVLRWIRAKASLLVLDQSDQRIDDYCPSGLADAGHLIDEALASTGRQQDSTVTSLQDLHDGLELTLSKAPLCEHCLKDFCERRLDILRIDAIKVGPHGWLEQIVAHDHWQASAPHNDLWNLAAGEGELVEGRQVGLEADE